MKPKQQPKPKPKQTTQNNNQTTHHSNTLLYADSGEPCFFGTRQGITQCRNCRAKLICKKHKETQ